MPIPTLVIAGTASGVGKTTVTCAIAAALQDRGYDVRLFKAGPDYLDPTIHDAATGGTSRNLDGWMLGREGVSASFCRGVSRRDDRPCIALVEGMMGLFDGANPWSLEGSTAELANLLRAPVVLVVDASAMARSAAAVVEGFVDHVPNVRVGGVVFQRVGSKEHGELLAQAMAGSRRRVAVLGSLPVQDELRLPSRHLGLAAAHVSPATATPAARTLWRDAISAWASEYIDLDAALALAQSALGPMHVPDEEDEPGTPHVRIGIARDEALHFYYPDNLDLLRTAGAELVPFSPVNDDALPPQLDGLYLGGGYPELHAEALSANTGMLDSLRAFATSGAPIYAECGGMMLLGDELADGDNTWAMAGLLPLQFRATGQLQSLGYREVTTIEPTLFGHAGLRFRGHAFHHSELVGTPTCARAYRVADTRGVTSPEGYSKGNILASYVHAHWGSNPALADRFVSACQRWRADV